MKKECKQERQKTMKTGKASAGKSHTGNPRRGRVVALHSIMRGRKLRFDAKTLRFTNDEDANKLLRVRPYRNEWRLDYVRV